MRFQYLVLEILKRIQNERSITSAFYLLRGKRSGQTIQDVGIFRLHSFFGILPKLHREVYDDAIQTLAEKQYIIVEKDSFHLTEKGEHSLKETEILPFDGWHYQGNEHIFFSRLSLIVQSLSYSKENIKSFSPIQKDERIQNWVRHFLIHHQYHSGLLQQRICDEIIQSLSQISIQEQAKEIVSKRLTGLQVPGFTWQQLSMELQMAEMDIQLLYIACLHSWLNEISMNADSYPYLYQMMENVRMDVPLSGSAYHTALLYRQGYSIEQISRIRKLKQNTIEDHIVELAMNDPAFPIEQFVKPEDIQEVKTKVLDYQTRKLKVLKEVLPHLSYFQIRLVLSKGEDL